MSDYIISTGVTYPYINLDHAKTEVRIEYVEKHTNFEIKKVHFNDPATVVIWADGTKTVVKCDKDDIYDPQTGLLMCIAKKAFGNKGRFNDILREWMPEEPEEETYITKGAQAFFDGLNNYFFGMEVRA